MNKAILSAVLGLCLAVSGCDSHVDFEEYVINTATPQDMESDLNHILDVYGEDALEKVVTSMGYLMSESFRAPQALGEGVIDESEGVEAILEAQDGIRDELQNMTVGEIIDQAKPIKESFLEQRRDRAIPRVAAFEQEKKRLQDLESIRLQLKASRLRVSLNDDEFGYPVVTLELDIFNPTDIALNHLQIVFLTPLQVQSQVMFSFPETPIAPGDTQTVSAELSPDDAANRELIGNPEVSLAGTPTNYYNVEGRHSLQESWTQSMQENLEQLRKYANYEG